MCFMSTTIPHFKHCFLKTNPHIVNEKANGNIYYRFNMTLNSVSNLIFAHA